MNQEQLIVDDESEAGGSYADLPDPRSLELGADAQTGVTQPRAQQRQANNEPDDGLPPELRGKSARELYDMLQAKEQMIGRQSTEIGHLRDLSDQLLRTQASQSALTARSQSGSDEEEVRVTTDDLLDRPVDAIRKVVNPLLQSAVSEIKDAVSGVQTNNAAQQFAQKFPTYEQDMRDPAFQQFVQGSRYRSRLAATARQYNDFEAAEELWEAWAEHQQQSQQEAPSNGDTGVEAQQAADEQERQRQLRAAQTMRSGSRDSGRAAGKPVYSARKLQDMRNNDPEGYYSPAFQKMLLEAYRDNRVR